MYQTDKVIEDAKAGTMSYKHLSYTSGVCYMETVRAEVLRCGGVYGESWLKSMFVEGYKICSPSLWRIIGVSTKVETYRTPPDTLTSF